MSTTQFECNKALLEAAESCDLVNVEKLLKLGADPLGSSNEQEPNEHILGDLFCNACHDEELAEKMPELVRLFLTYGMDIGARNIPDDEDNINPLWELAFVNNDNGLKVLKTLLDHQLDCRSAESMVNHILIDMEMCDGCRIEDEWWIESWTYSLKMIMLAASYPYIVNGSAYIGECIALKENDAEKLPLFRNYHRFSYHIDLSTCDHIPHGLRNATLIIKDKENDEIVWSFLI